MPPRRPRRGRRQPRYRPLDETLIPDGMTAPTRDVVDVRVGITLVITLACGHTGMLLHDDHTPVPTALQCGQCVARDHRPPRRA